MLADAPALADFVSQASCEHFEALLQLLQSLGIEYSINPKLVRGLDYYNNCVFEWTTEQLGAQSAVCGGGRYDGLVAQLGGRPTVAAGFAMGVERLVLMLETLERVPESYRRPVDVYVLTASEVCPRRLCAWPKPFVPVPRQGYRLPLWRRQIQQSSQTGIAAGASLAVVLEAAGDNAPLSVKIRT